MEMSDRYQEWLEKPYQDSERYNDMTDEEIEAEQDRLDYEEGMLYEKYDLEREERMLEDYERA